jgi:hypothetical protein
VARRVARDVGDASREPRLRISFLSGRRAMRQRLAFLGVSAACVFAFVTRSGAQESPLPPPLQESPLPPPLQESTLVPSIEPDIALVQAEAAADASGAEYPSLVTMITDGGYAYTQPDKNAPLYRVTVESGGEASVVVVQEREAGWNGADGKPVKYIQLYSAFSPTYEKSVEPSAKMLRTLAEETDGSVFSSYSVYTDAASGNWTLYVNAHIFHKGMTAEELSEYLGVVHGRRLHARTKILPLVEQP